MKLAIGMVTVDEKLGMVVLISANQYVASQVL
jgi:hypothetical protein